MTTLPHSMPVMRMGQVCLIFLCWAGALSFVSRRRLCGERDNRIVKSDNRWSSLRWVHSYNRHFQPLTYQPGLVTNSNVTMVDQISGVMGLGFPRLSSISNSVTNCTSLLTLFPRHIAKSQLSYPLLRGLGATRTIGLPPFRLQLDQEHVWHSLNWYSTHTIHWS